MFGELCQQLGIDDWPMSGKSGGCGEVLKHLLHASRLADRGNPDSNAADKRRICSYAGTVCKCALIELFRCDQLATDQGNNTKTFVSVLAIVVIVVNLIQIFTCMKTISLQ